MVSDAYARSSGPLAKAGAAYMKIMNHSSENDRLIRVFSDIAKKTELHRHLKSDNGVMKMVRIDEGIKVGAMKQHVLARGGDHIMFMGLKEPFETGKIIPVTLHFEKTTKNDSKIQLVWMDGGLKPSHPEEIPAEDFLGEPNSTNGILMIGDIIADNRHLIADRASGGIVALPHDGI